MLYKVFLFLLPYRNGLRITRWCVGKTKNSIIKKFGKNIHFQKLDEGGKLYMEIELKRGTLCCTFLEDCCIESLFFSHSEQSTNDFPENIAIELKERKHATGQEKINPDLFNEYDINNFSPDVWLNLRPFIIKRVIERGSICDFYAIIEIYTYDGVVYSICNEIESLSADAINVARALFDIPLKNFKTGINY